jgi:hypothetical protein
MDFLPLFSQECHIAPDELFGGLDVGIGDPPDDLDNVLRGQVDFHDGTGFGDVNVRRWVIKVEIRTSKPRSRNTVGTAAIIPKALG